MEENKSFLEEKEAKAPKKKAVKKPESINAEVIASPDRITDELVKVNITDTAIAEMKEKFLVLKVNGVSDKEGLAEVYKSRQMCKNTRLLVVSVCKKGREAAIAEQKAWVSKEKEIVGQISEVENYLQAQEDIVNQEKERIKAEKEAKEQERLHGRIAQLTSKKMGFDGVNYTLGSLTISSVQVKLMDDFSYNGFLSQVESAYQEELARLAEIERIQKERAEEAVRIAEEQTKKEAELKAREEALAAAEAKAKAEQAVREKEAQEAQMKVLAEAAAKAKEEGERKLALLDQQRKTEDGIIQQRLIMFPSASWNGQDAVYQEKVVIDRASLLTLPSDKLAELAQAHNDHVRSVVEAEQEVTRKKIEDAENAAREQERQLIEEELRQEAEVKRLEAKLVENNAALAISLQSDQEKLIRFATQMGDMVMPTMTSAAGMLALGKCSEALKKVIAYINQQANTL